jgi:hypothetical protein
MDITGLVCHSVVVSMMGGPPNWAPLNSGATKDREKKLQKSGGFKRPVRKITVIKTGDSKHPYKVEQKRHPQGERTPPHKNHPKATDVHGDEGKDSGPIDPQIPFRFNGGSQPRFSDLVLCIKPLNHLRAPRQIRCLFNYSYLNRKKSRQILIFFHKYLDKTSELCKIVVKR